MTRPSRRNRTAAARALTACALLFALTLVIAPPARAERAPSAGAGGAAGLAPAGAALPQAQPAGSPIGRLDSLSAKDRVVYPDPVRTQVLYGWASDPDSPQEPVNIHIYADGQPYERTGLVSHARPDVQAVLPWVGPNTGFELGIVSPEESRQPPRTYCAYAINVGPGANTTLGCVVAPNPSTDGYEPIGALDSASVSPGMLTLTGWAGDPDYPNSALAFSAHRGGSPSLGSRFVANQPRPDVASAYPRLGGTTGFSLGIALPPGLHYICLKIENLGRQGLHHRNLGCAFVLIPDNPPAGPHDPIGHVDWVRYTGVGWCCPSWIAEGWAADPDAPGAIDVRVHAGGGYGFTVTTQVARPDVQAAYPWAGPNTGFTSGFTSGLSSGHMACAYAIQAGEGAGSQWFLGCTTMGPNGF